jgi:hypothetical protein
VTKTETGEGRTRERRGDRIDARDKSSSKSRIQKWVRKRDAEERCIREEENIRAQEEKRSLSLTKPQRSCCGLAPQVGA